MTVMFCTDVGVCLCGIKLSITASSTTSEWTLTVDLREMEGWRGLQDLTVKLLEKRAVLVERDACHGSRSSPGNS